MTDFGNLPSNQPPPLADAMPVGAILPWPTATAPTNYLLCDGAQVDKTTYATLWDVIGAAFGPAGGSTFYLPDLRGRVPVGEDGTGGNSRIREDWYLDTLGHPTATEGEQGDEVVPLDTTQMPPHSHFVGGLWLYNIFAGSNTGAFGSAGLYGTASLGSSSQGNNQAHENLMPYQCVHYVIRALPFVQL